MESINFTDLLSLDVDNKAADHIFTASVIILNDNTNRVPNYQKNATAEAQNTTITHEVLVHFGSFIIEEEREKEM